MNDRHTEEPTGGKIRVLIVDDSTFVRRALIRVLRAADDVEIVGEARDGMAAIDAARRLKPDVMTLDLQMPKLGGLDVLRVLRDELPTRIIMVSSFTREGAEETFQALEEGAFDFVDKTRVRNRVDFINLGQDLLAKIRLAMGQATAESSAIPPARVNPPQSAPAPPARTARGLLIVGASTGGPPAVRRFLNAFSPSFPAAIVIVQHMPPGFSEGFARRLNQMAPIIVSEAVDGEVLLPAHAYVVPSGMEADFAVEDGVLRMFLREGDADEKHRPSLDHTLTRAAVLDVPRLAVVLTGMGADGAEGAVQFVSSGGDIAVQDADSCVIHGMPRAVANRVEVAFEAPPDELGEWASRVMAGLTVDRSGS